MEWVSKVARFEAFASMFKLDGQPFLILPWMREFVEDILDRHHEVELEEDGVRRVEMRRQTDTAFHTHSPDQ